MREELLQINEKVKYLAELLKPIVMRAIPGEKKAALRESIEEGIKLLRENERVFLSFSPADIYMIGKIFGRLEAIYSLLHSESDEKMLRDE
jgi:hypothetical protein